MIPHSAPSAQRSSHVRSDNPRETKLIVIDTVSVVSEDDRAGRVAAGRVAGRGASGVWAWRTIGGQAYILYSMWPAALPARLVG